VSEQHLSLDELAELAEGLLARRRSRAAHEHLATCETCRDHAEAISATTAALREVGPVTMPAEVVARLDRVLASASDAPAGETVVPDLSAVRQRRLPNVNWSYAAAAAVVVIAGVSIAVAATGGRHHPATEAATQLPRPLVATTAPRSIVQLETGRTYQPSSLSQLVPGLLGTPTDSTAAGLGASGLAEPAPSAAGAHGTAGPKRYATNLPSEAPQNSATGGVVPAPLRRYADSRPTLLACAALITDTHGAQPLAVDFARWSNPTAHVKPVPALVMVFADPQDSDKLDVYVVAPACNDGSLLDYLVLTKN
jgi:hypothetical protein